MASNRGVFRNVNILHEFNAGSGTGIIDIYQPGWLNAEDVVANAKYSAFITSLRLTIDISSINQMNIVPSEVLDNESTIVENNKQTFNYNQKKCLTFYMKTANTPLIKIADIFLFNQRPYYYLDLINYFTSAGTFDVAPDSMLACQISDIGDGILANDDRVMLLGCAVEESPYSNDLSTSSLPINITVPSGNAVNSTYTKKRLEKAVNTFSTLLVTSNVNRKGLLFSNNSDTDICLDIDETVTVDSYLIKLLPGGYYEAPSPIHIDAFYAVATSFDASIDIREFI